MDWLPTDYHDGVLLGLTTLVALRTFMRALVASLDWLDGLDGYANWQWLHQVANFLDRVDAILARLPVKAPLTRQEPRERSRPAWDFTREAL